MKSSGDENVNVDVRLFPMSVEIASRVPTDAHGRLEDSAPNAALLTILGVRDPIDASDAAAVRGLIQAFPTRDVLPNFAVHRLIPS